MHKNQLHFYILISLLKKTKKIILFKIASKIIKYLGIS